MKRGRKLGSLALASVLFFAVLLIPREEPRETDAPEPSRRPMDEERASVPAARQTEPPLTTSAAAPVRSPLGAAERDAATARIRERWGSELELQFAPDGRLVSVRGRPGRSRSAGNGFKPDDPQKALARAREILASVEGLLGVRPDWPLEHPVAKGSAVSAQVFFQQSHDGVTISPFGSVSIDLDSHGGLLRLDSSYVRDPEIVNSRVLSSGDAKARAALAGEAASRGAIDGGDAVLWVSRGQGGRPQARHAYDYYVHGRQIVVDASNGGILFKRDRRQH